MDYPSKVKAIQPGLTGQYDEDAGEKFVELRGVGVAGSTVLLQVTNWEPIQELLELCERSLTYIRQDCPHTSPDDLVGLGYCEWCGMGDLEVEEERKAMEVSSEQRVLGAHDQG